MLVRGKLCYHGCGAAAIEGSILWLRVERFRFTIQSDQTTWSVVVDHVYGGFKSALVVVVAMWVRLLEWLGGSMTPLTAKQARIFGVSNDGSSEAPELFKVVRDSGCGEPPSPRAFY